ncbi:hypothetical protein MBLNU230_g0242t1 [Neophaeotheca triangularis]
MAGESRQELLAWLNSLLQLSMTKVEQCGTGAAFCQVYDSIFLDVPMSRVKFNVNTEYAYLENFKILSNCFRKHNIERTIPIQDLIKCKMQDNLDFLQYTKRYWDQYYPGGDYDAASRRKGAGPGAAPAMPPSRTGGAGGGSGTAARRAAPAASAAAPRSSSRQMGGSTGGASSAQNAALSAKNAELMETVTGLERERDFYFSKLRDIELLIQQAMEAEPALEQDEGSLLKQIQTILYSTEEGFEIPAEGDGANEEETF